MENQGAKIGSKILKIIGILLAIGAVCLIVVKIYNKFFRKEQPVVEGDADGVDALEGDSSAADVAAEAETFEVPAAAVIVNADQMEA